MCIVCVFCGVLYFTYGIYSLHIVRVLLIFLRYILCIFVFRRICVKTYRLYRDTSLNIFYDIIKILGWCETIITFYPTTFDRGGFRNNYVNHKWFMRARRTSLLEFKCEVKCVYFTRVWSLDRVARILSKIF